MKKLDNPALGSYHWQTITRETVLNAIAKTNSNLQAARYLGVSKQTWKKYASMYNDDAGNNCYTSHCNKYGIGLRKKNIDDEDKFVQDILLGHIPPTNYDPIALKRKIIKEGFIEEKCCRCMFDDKRISDQKSPLLIVFRDGDKKNWTIDNIALYCHNCYFLYVGEVYTKKQLSYIEGIKNPKNVHIERTLELSQVHMKALEDILTNKLQRDPGRVEINPDDLIDTY